MGASFSQENGNFLDDHFLNKMANFYNFFFQLRYITAKYWRRRGCSHIDFPSRFCVIDLITLIMTFAVMYIVHSNVLILFLVWFCCFATRFPVKNLKAHIWRTLTGSDAKISRKGQCLSTSSTIGIFMSTGKVSWNRSHPNFVRNWQSRCFNSVIRN